MTSSNTSGIVNIDLVASRCALLDLFVVPFPWYKQYVIITQSALCVLADGAFFLWKDHVKRQTRFVSRKPAKVIISAIESVAESMNLKFHTRNYKVELVIFA